VWGRSSKAGPLSEVLSPHADEVVVIGVQESRGPKSDQRDAFALAEKLRIGAVGTRVFKEVGPYRKLRELARVHTMVVRDVVRVKSRINVPEPCRGSACGLAVRSSTWHASRNVGFHAASRYSTIERVSWTVSNILLQIKQRKAERLPLAASKVPPKLLHAAVNYLGSWDAALMAAGLDPGSIRLARHHFGSLETVAAGLGEEDWHWTRATIRKEMFRRLRKGLPVHRTKLQEQVGGLDRQSGAFSVLTTRSTVCSA
jgi:hypothetical protein